MQGFGGLCSSSMEKNVFIFQGMVRKKVFLKGISDADIETLLFVALGLQNYF